MRWSLPGVERKLTRASPVTAYQHAHPCVGRQAADRFAALLRADQRLEVSPRNHEPFRPAHDKAPGS